MTTKKVQEITARYRRSNLTEFKVTSSQIVSDTVRDIFPVEIDHREAMVCLYLNRANMVVSWGTISVGGISGTTIDNRVIMQQALMCNASSIILVHNHPSGNTEPSSTDINVTDKLKEVAKIMEIPLLDHLIITAKSYYSFSDNGLL